MAIHSSVLAWRIPGMVEPGGLPSMGSHRVGHDWNNLAAAAVARHRQARSQNKGLTRASQLRTSPSPARDRQVRAARAGRGQL